MNLTELDTISQRINAANLVNNKIRVLKGLQDKLNVSEGAVICLKTNCKNAGKNNEVQVGSTYPDESFNGYTQKYLVDLLKIHLAADIDKKIAILEKEFEEL